MVNAAVGSLVGVASSREQEEGGVINSWQGLVLSVVRGAEDELEGAAFILRSDGAHDAEM